MVVSLSIVAAEAAVGGLYWLRKLENKDNHFGWLIFLWKMYVKKKSKFFSGVFTLWGLAPKGYHEKIKDLLLIILKDS